MPPPFAPGQKREPLCMALAGPAILSRTWWSHPAQETPWAASPGTSNPAQTPELLLHSRTSPLEPLVPHSNEP